MRCGPPCCVLSSPLLQCGFVAQKCGRRLSAQLLEQEEEALQAARAEAEASVQFWDVGCTLSSKSERSYDLQNETSVTAHKCRVSACECACFVCVSKQHAGECASGGGREAKTRGAADGVLVGQPGRPFGGSVLQMGEAPVICSGGSFQ